MKTADVTVSWWPWKTDTEWMASRKSHSLKVESLLEVTTRRDVGWADAWVSSSSWPDNWWRSSPVCVSQMQAKRSQPVEGTFKDGDQKFRNSCLACSDGLFSAGQPVRGDDYPAVTGERAKWSPQNGKLKR